MFLYERDLNMNAKIWDLMWFENEQLFQIRNPMWREPELGN